MSRWDLPPLSVGEFAPGFAAATHANPKFHFDTAAGRYLLLGFFPRDPAARRAALAAFEAHRSRFDGIFLAAFFVASDPQAVAEAEDHLPGQRWFLDPEGAVARLYGARGADEADQPFWLLLDPMLRVLEKAPFEDAAPLFARLAALPPLGHVADAPPIAPVLIVPRIFEPDLCRKLIAYYEADGGRPSGVMRERDGRTIGVFDPNKSRRDVHIPEADPLRAALRARLASRLAPEIARALQFKATRVERYLVACYAADEGGRFGPHRDNETRGTAHRRFAVSINLNDDFTGGDLWFPEFGPRTYRPPVGGAVVFCCSLQHAAMPVTAGRRYAFLPFLYDEEGARIRAENRAFLDLTPPSASQ